MTTNLEPATDPRLGPLAAEVREGLKRHKARMDAARKVQDYYDGEGLQYLEAQPDEDPIDFQQRPKSGSRLVAQVVDRLTEDNYSTPGPARSHPDAGSWSILDRVYATNHINALMQEAERRALLNGVCAIQVAAIGDPARPAELYLWGAEEFAAWVPGDDCRNPYAVCTVSVDHSRHPGRRCLKFVLWSAVEYRTFYSKPAEDTNAGLPIGATVAHDFEPADSGPNPYGVLPFVFIHARPPVREFWQAGIGDQLVEANAAIDRKLSLLDLHIEKFLNPFLALINCAPNQQITVRPGDFVHLRAAQALKGGDQGGEPDARFIQAMLGVESAWADIRERAALVIEELGLPLSAVRADATTDLSGVAIVARMEPLQKRSRAAQAWLAECEKRLAGTILAALSGHYSRAPLDGAQRAYVDSIAKANAASKLIVGFRPTPILVQTAERDASDQWAIERGQKTELEILCERRGLTIEEGVQLLKEMARQRKLWAEAWGDDPPAPPSSGKSPDGDGDDLVDEEDDDEQGDDAE